MKNYQPDLLLIYYKRKDNIPLTEEEQQVWAQYRDRHPLPDEIEEFDKELILELAGSSGYTRSWEQFKQENGVESAGEKQTTAARVIRWAHTHRYKIAAAALLLVITTVWIGKPDRNTIDTVAWRQQLRKVLYVPVGSQRELVLPDSTKVWLNAATTFRYPDTFGDERIVELVQGEAWFEVAKTPRSQPFVVMVKGKQVKVLGTRFNVRAYDSISNIVTTTLEEGKVELITGDQQKILSPGQQADMNEKNIDVRTGARLEDVKAWKKGVFSFYDTRLSIIMEELARWYDVEVEYNAPIDDIPFTIGAYNRRDSLVGLLDHLEASGLLHFKLEDKKVIIDKP